MAAASTPVWRLLGSGQDSTLLPWPLIALGGTWSTGALLVLAGRLSRSGSATAAAPTPAGSAEAVTTSVPHPSGRAPEQT